MPAGPEAFPNSFAAAKLRNKKKKSDKSDDK